MISDHMVDAFNRAYAAVYEQSAPITTQGEVVAVERAAVRAGIEAALDLIHTMQRTDLAREVAQHQRALRDRIRPKAL